VQAAPTREIRRTAGSTCTGFGSTCAGSGSVCHFEARGPDGHRRQRGRRYPFAEYAALAALLAAVIAEAQSSRGHGTRECSAQNITLPSPML
jgi:hypothetical protein